MKRFAILLVVGLVGLVGCADAPIGTERASDLSSPLVREEAATDDSVADAIIYLVEAGNSVDRAIYETGNTYGPDVDEAINAAGEAESQLSIAMAHLAAANVQAFAYTTPEILDQAGALLYLGAARHSVDLALAEVDGIGGVDAGEAMNYAAEAISQLGIAIGELEAIEARAPRLSPLLAGGRGVAYPGGHAPFARRDGSGSFWCGWCRRGGGRGPARREPPGGLAVRPAWPPRSWA